MADPFSGTPGDTGGGNGGPGNRVFRSRQVLLLAVTLVLVTALATFGVTGYIYRHQFGRLAELQDISESEQFTRLLDVIRLVRDNYVEAVDLDTLLEGAAQGAVEALEDPYSLYFDATQFESFRISISGQYDGIGVVVTERDRYVTVQSPFPGTPGATTPFEEAGPGDPKGLLPGDRIIEVDGGDIVGMPVEQAAAIIRGPAGSDVVLTVVRTGEDGQERRLTFRITRARVEVPTVESAMLEGDVGYVRLLQFTPITPRATAQAITDLRQGGMRALVLDLRNNPGGDLESSRQVAELFVPRGPVVHIVERDAQPVTLMSDTDAFDLPLVVLVNEGSASASEIVAGAIQDYAVAPLVGETTFGKGSVQQIWNLNNGTTAQGLGPGLKVTTARYLTPNERSIDGEGIVPDVVVEQALDIPLGDAEADLQLKRALEILAGRLGG